MQVTPIQRVNPVRRATSMVLQIHRGAASVGSSGLQQEALKQKRGRPRGSTPKPRDEPALPLPDAGLTPARLGGAPKKRGRPKKGQADRQAQELGVGAAPPQQRAPPPGLPPPAPKASSAGLAWAFEAAGTPAAAAEHAAQPQPPSAPLPASVLAPACMAQAPKQTEDPPAPPQRGRQHLQRQQQRGPVQQRKASGKGQQQAPLTAAPARPAPTPLPAGCIAPAMALPAHQAPPIPLSRWPASPAWEAASREVSAPSVHPSRVSRGGSCGREGDR